MSFYFKLLASVAIATACIATQAQFRDLSVKRSTPVSDNLPVLVLLTRVKPSGDANRLSEAKDGDPLWVTIRASQPLITIAKPEPDDKSPGWYELHLAIGPADDAMTDYGPGSCFVKITPQQAARSEFSMPLSPGATWQLEVAKTSGKGGGGGSRTERFKGGCFLETVSGMRAAPGVWKNRVSVRDLRPGSPTEAQIVGNAPLTVDVAGGFAQYRRALQALDACQPKSAEPLICQ